MTKKNTMLLRLMLFMALAMIAFSLVACDKPSVMPEPQESSTTKETSIVLAILASFGHPFSLKPYSGIPLNSDSRNSFGSANRTLVQMGEIILA